MGEPLKSCLNCGRDYKSETDFLKGTTRWRVCTDGNLWFNCGCMSTLMIPKGKYDWYSPGMGMQPKARQLFNLISKNESLPYIPAAVMRLQEMLQKSDWSAAHFAKMVKQEPLIATELLAMAQRIKGARNPHDRPIESLEHAIMYVGRQAVNDLVQVAAMRSFRLETKDFDADQFWHESFLCGAIAEQLCQRLELGYGKDEVYLAGSLANVGKIVAAIAFPDQVDQVVRDLNHPSSAAPWSVLEAKHSCHDHTILGEVGAAFWGFPETVLEGARYHHTLPYGGDRSGVLAIPELVNLSMQLSHWLLLQPERIDKVGLAQISENLGWEEKDIEVLASELSYLKDNQVVAA